MPKPAEVARLLRRLDSADPGERAEAVRALSPLLGQDERVDSALSASAKFDPDPTVREIARQAVERAASAAAPPPTQIVPPPPPEEPPVTVALDTPSAAPDEFPAAVEESAAEPTSAEPLPPIPVPPDATSAPADSLPMPPPGAETGLRWTCSFCGTTGITGNVCPACGTTRAQSLIDAPLSSPWVDTSPPRVPPQSGKSGWAWDDEPFLMDPHNEAVLTGRKRRRSNLALGCLLLLGVLWMCCMGVTLFGGATSWYYNKELDEKGVVVDGVVMKRRENPGTRNTAASYYVTYVFKLDPDGRPYTREQQVSLHTYATAFSSATVQIKVLPSDPEHSTLVGDSTERDSAISTVRLSMVCLVGLTIILPMFYVARRRSGSPKRRGQILRGEIVAARAEPSSAGDLWLSVECRFVTPDGQTITHTERRMRNDLGRTRLPPDGAPVAVLYRSPQNFEIL